MDPLAVLALSLPPLARRRAAGAEQGSEQRREKQRFFHHIPFLTGCDCNGPFQTGFLQIAIEPGNVRYATDLGPAGQQSARKDSGWRTSDPDILLVDEPTASLDPKTGRQIMRLITELADERELTAIINIHDVALAKAFAARIVGLRKGEIVFDGMPEELTVKVLTEIYGEEDWSQTLDESGGAESEDDVKANGARVRNGAEAEVFNSGEQSLRHSIGHHH